MGLAYNPPPQRECIPVRVSSGRDHLNMKTKIVAIVALAAAASMLFTACNPECIDTFDCPKKANNTAACAGNKCSYIPDAGS